MDTVNSLKQISIAFINDKSPIIDAISNELAALGIDILFRSESVEGGLSQLSVLKTLPQVCIIDLDFYDKNVLAKLQELRIQYPTIKLIAHSDIDADETAKALRNLGFSSYLLIGSDMDDFKKTIDNAVNG